MQRERKMKFSDMTLGQKVEHIWEYYKLVLLGIAAAIALIIYIIVKLVWPDPDTLMNVTMINATAYAVEDSTIFDTFLTEQGYDTTEETIFVNSSLFFTGEGNSQSEMASYQALTAMVMVGEIDLLCGDEAVFGMLGSGGGLMKLEEVLPDSLMQEYQDDIYKVVNEETGEEFLCGIWLPEDNPLSAEGYYTGRVLVGIPYTSENQELAAVLLQYLLEK